jgi:hypothetical protein
VTFTPLGVTSEMVAALICDDDARKPRSLQRAPGPSALGTLCARQLGYLVAGVEPVSGGGDPLPRWVGTEGHSGMDRILAANPDWSTEHRITLPGYGINGHVDAFHHPSGTVVDWKFVGVSSLRDYKANGPSQQYRWQAHLYGTGMALQGHAVRTVAIAFIPRSGITSGIYVWSESYDPSVTEAALARYEQVQGLVAAGLLPIIPTADAPCNWCNWHNPNSTDPRRSCAGHNPQEGAQA